MTFWSKNNKIEFFHNEPSILENFPIMESKDLKLNWVKRARKDFEYSVKKSTGSSTLEAVNSPGFTHLTRCPGIFDLFKYGYIIPLHKDFIITRKGAGFEWLFTVGGNESISEHFDISGFSESITNMCPKPPWSANFIIKIETGWNVIAPKGIKFIMLPIAYPDTFDFTSSIGIHNPALSTQVNFQMFWNGTDEKTVIKAGTPLGHLIPLTEKKYQMVQRIMNQRDKDWIIKVSSTFNSTFWPHTVRKKITDMYNNHWKR